MNPGRGSHTRTRPMQNDEGVGRALGPHVSVLVMSAGGRVLFQQSTAAVLSSIAAGLLFTFAERCSLSALMARPHVMVFQQLTVAVRSVAGVFVLVVLHGQEHPHASGAAELSADFRDSAEMRGLLARAFAAAVVRQISKGQAAPTASGVAAKSDPAARRVALTDRVRSAAAVHGSASGAKEEPESQRVLLPSKSWAVLLPMRLLASLAMTELIVSLCNDHGRHLNEVLLMSLSATCGGEALHNTVFIAWATSHAPSSEGAGVTGAPKPRRSALRKASLSQWREAQNSASVRLQASAATAVAAASAFSRGGRASSPLASTQLGVENPRSWDSASSAPAVWAFATREAEMAVGQARVRARATVDLDAASGAMHSRRRRAAPTASSGAMLSNSREPDDSLRFGGGRRGRWTPWGNGPERSVGSDTDPPHHRSNGSLPSDRVSGVVQDALKSKGLYGEDLEECEDEGAGTVVFESGPVSMPGSDRPSKWWFPVCKCQRTGRSLTLLVTVDTISGFFSSGKRDPLRRAIHAVINALSVLEQCRDQWDALVSFKRLSGVEAFGTESRFLTLTSADNDAWVESIEEVNKHGFLDEHGVAPLGLTEAPVVVPRIEPYGDRAMLLAALSGE
jgi:hypothetical protein